MKISLTIETIKGVDVALEGITIELDCSASEVIKVLAGVKTLIEGTESEVNIQKMFDKIMVQATKEAKPALDIIRRHL